MRKFSILLIIIPIACIMGGLYGILHDQLTYTISPEYYTKFKFYQFELKESGDEAIFPNPRLMVSIVGFFATWWMGLFIGLILGLVGLIHADSRRMFRITMRAMFITMAIAFVTGIAGLAYGKWYLADAGVDWYLPDNLIDKKHFIMVGSMHNFSYLGGVIGLLAGVIYSFRQKDQQPHLKSKP